ncbi:hypothetical protein SAMN05660845_1914 [Flavobacterium swingsii]|uniref:DUF4393 domain-containing protein n=1 Tax=Flavobacterium swingsii TaxID=498292 RepID=A0A1I0YRL4_9FLAO|nr:hypothetical protein [Flavobacterium swingsii]SFB15954.1 hypothetical protein SAMN05660845_1914 [Flavobacterium swingsii]
MDRNLLEKYEDSNVLRALVNFIPYIGGSLDILLSAKGSIWREERLKSFLSILDKRISELENQEVIIKISESEEFYDLLIQSMNSVIKTRHHEKIECYANILTNSLINHGSSISSELFISTLDIITIDEIKYLAELKKNSYQIHIEIIDRKKVLWQKYLNQLETTGDTNVSDECIFKLDIDLIWKLLSDKNLITINGIKHHRDLDYTYSTRMSSIKSSVLSTKMISYNITEFGEEFIEWISR